MQKIITPEGKTVYHLDETNPAEAELIEKFANVKSEENGIRALMDMLHEKAAAMEKMKTDAWEKIKTLLDEADRPKNAVYQAADKTLTIK